MEKLSEIQNRKINFGEFDTSKNWIAEFPNEKWCLLIIAEEENRRYFDEIIRKSIDRNVGYIFSVGKQQNLIHGMADEEILIRDIENFYLPKHIIIIAGNYDFENGIWEGIYTTHKDETEIEQIIILDVTRKSKSRLIELLNKFELGYIPQD